MITIVSDNIVSSLGFSTEENFSRLKQGISGLKYHDNGFDLPEPYVASTIDEARLDGAFETLLQEKYLQESKYPTHFVNVLKMDFDEWKTTYAGYTKLEKAAIVSAAEALKKTDIDPESKKVLFILSTTKGNIHVIDKDYSKGLPLHRAQLSQSADFITEYFENYTSTTISNACISGANAMIAAQRALLSRRYKYAVVIGVDMLSRFIISGFQSFKALSQSECRPFDEHRDGLNIGEAAATIILTNKPKTQLQPGDVVLTAGAIRNDANHISGPSRTGEGACRALKAVCSGIKISELAFINAHGTATPYNDEMEAVAITRAGLQDVPVTCLKGYFGHTLGAAGVLESVIATRSLREQLVLKTLGFKTSGVTHRLPIVTETQSITKKHCINMLSGFGGCNAALLHTLI
ncbi:MAG: beta-ketoacyl synthase [Tannerella sp.]|jgi:3-oxoacyl-[acyl-carrier-protein] synthase-1|nr:beta-ketoacyl synthase [Tannerella sp.]